MTDDTIAHYRRKLDDVKGQLLAGVIVGADDLRELLVLSLNSELLAALEREARLRDMMGRCDLLSTSGSAVTLDFAEGDDARDMLDLLEQYNDQQNQPPEPT